MSQVTQVKQGQKPEDLLDPKIKKALDVTTEKRIENNKDFPCIVSGEEGNGKSALAIQMADYVDDNFDLEKQVCMGWKDLIRTADEVPKGSALILDEGVNGALGREHSKKGNKVLMKWLREIRAKCLYIFILAPEYAEFENYLTGSRAKGLVRCVKQGWAHFYNRSKMNNIEITYENGNIKVDYPEPLFRAGWDNPEGTEFWKKYQKEKKQPNINSLADKYLDSEDDDGVDVEEVVDESVRLFSTIFDMVQISREERIEFSKTIYNNQYLDVSQADIADIFNISKSTANNYVNQ